MVSSALKLPTDSKISVSEYNDFTMVTLPYAPQETTRYLVAVFLLFWMMGWYKGFISVLNEVVAGNTDTFLILWLLVWMVAGVFIVSLIYKKFKKAMPERFLLNKPNLAYDAGFDPSSPHKPSSHFPMWRTLFSTQRRYNFSPEHIQTLRLVSSKGVWLTIDMDGESIEMGKNLSQPEKEWLYHYLQEQYA